MRRFGVIGDIHCEDIFLAAALDELTREGVDGILAVGDIADGRGDLDRCCDLLAAHRVTAVAGNHDRWLVNDQVRDLPHANRFSALSEQTRSYLKGLPRTVRIETVAGPLLLCHGLGENDMAKVGPDDEGYALESNLELQALLRSDFSLVANGHSHRRMVRRFGALTIINAGTLLFKDQPGFVLVDLESRAVRCYDLDAAGQLREAQQLALD
jgi:predicted phosphodiesterase